MEALAQVGWAVSLAWLAAGAALPVHAALRVTLAMVLLPMLPELSQLAGAEPFLRWHQGPAQAPLVDLAWLLLLAAWARHTGLPLARVVLLGLTTRAGAHVLCAAFPDGVALAWPHQDARLGWRFLSPQDPVPSALLVVSLALGHASSRRVHGAVTAITLAAAYLGFASAAQTAVQRLAGLHLARQGTPPWSVKLMCVAQSPLGLRWLAVASDQDEALLLPVDLGRAPGGAVRVLRGMEEPLVGEFRHDPRSRAWWAHAAVPMAVSERRVDGRVEVFTRDLARTGRFAAPGAPVPYDAWTLADEDGRIMDLLLHVPMAQAPLLASRALVPPRGR